MLTKSKFLDIKEILSRADLRVGDQVGDLGCGHHGFFVFGAAKIVKEQGTVYAVDILKSNLEEVKSRSYLENLHNVLPIWADLEEPNSIKLKNGSLDACFLINVLYQVKKVEVVLEEAIRLLKVRGRIVVVDWNHVKGPIGPPMDSRISPLKIKELALRHGLRLDREFSPGQYHFGLVFIK